MATLFDENRFEAEIDSKVKTIVKNELPKESVHRATVLRRDSSGTWWVRLDSGDETPVLVNKVDMSVGDVVTVTLRDHVTYADGNITSPPMSAYNATNYVDDVVAKNVKAVTADIGYLKADVATIGYAQIEDADITNARIQNLVYEVTQNITHLNALDATINNLDANYAHITNGVIDNAKIGYADVEDLDVNYAHITEGVIDNAKIGYADVEDLDVNYAHIDLANVNNAWITNGVIADAAISDAQIIGVSANKLTAGTIDADTIHVTNLSTDNLKVKKINGQPILGGYSAVSNKISGYSSKNPVTEGWYELNAGNFVLSQDTTVNASKVYYAVSDSTLLYDQGTIDNMVSDLNSRIDAQIETWTEDHVPTLNNSPASSWTTNDLKAEHVGDICYVLNAGGDYDGYTYRFAYDQSTSSYKWVLIKDNQVTAALGRISDLETFESTTTSWIEETDEGIETIRENHTILSGVVDKTVVESVQLWFTKSNTTAPSKPYNDDTTTPVTNNSPTGSNSYNKWNLAVPEYNATYPNYFYCWQYKLADDKYRWSAVIRDIAMGESQAASRGAQTTANANIKSTVMLWFSKANDTAPSAPSSHVTNNSPTGSNSYNKWNIAVPVYNSSYPYYFYCYEYQKGDNSYAWSSVVYDRATTEAQSTARATASSLSTYITTNDAALSALQSQVDGQLEIWYGSSNPTASSAPASGWSADEKASHVGDMYYNTTTGAAFQWTVVSNIYSWTEIPDSAAASALAAAQDAQATADGKRRVFTSQPTVPYDIGDLWVNGDEVKYATAKRTSGSYTASEWAQTATDDTVANAAQTTANANIKSSVMLWYTSNSTTPPSKPYTDGSASYVSSTSIAGNTWTTVVPTYSSSTPKYHYCYQQQRGDGKYQWTNPVYDDATTTAMAKAQAALPASTFTTFESTTFKNVKDTVDEQTMTITNLSTTVQYGGANLLAIKDFLTPSGGPDSISADGFVADSTPTGDARAWSYANSNWKVSLKAGTYTLSWDVDTAASTSTSDGLAVYPSSGSVIYTATGNSSPFNAVGSGSKTFTLESATDIGVMMKTYEGVVRLKLEHGPIATPWEYASGDITTMSNTVNTVSETATSNSATISQLTTTLGTNADGTPAANDVVHRIATTEHDLDGISSRVTRTEGRVIGHYATSETGAGTTAKTATIMPTYSGTFTPANGTTVTVKFTYANTATNPTLNVNSSGAKAIKDHDGGAFTANWAAGDEVTFVYDGTCWRADNRSVYSAVSMAESQIKQNADNIELKVSETDVTGNYLISKINLDATSATISADRVEINGTTIFTAIRSDVENVAKDAVSDLDQFVRGYAYSPTDDSVAAEGVTYYYRTPTYSEASVTAGETDVSDMYELVGWDYVPTADLVAESDKTYYERTPSYEQVSTTAGTTDVSGLYELDDGVYVPTEDDVAQSGKPYFRIEDEYEVFPTTAGSTDVTGKFVYTGNASVIGSIGAVNDALSESIEQQGAFNEGVTGQIAGIRSDLRSFVEVEPGDSTATPPVPPSVTVGYMDGEGAYANYRTVVGSDGVDIVNEDGVSVAKYGAEQRLGPVDSPHMVADGDTLMFLPAGATDIGDAAAYIDVDENGEGQLHIARAAVDTEMRFGSFAWVKRTNGNLALKWIGE